jgi:hypothetical protein
MASRNVKTNVTFGLSPTDELVKTWLEKHGIAPSDVTAYRITRGSHNIPTIELTMVYSEEEAAGDGVPS